MEPVDREFSIENSSRHDVVAVGIEGAAPAVAEGNDNPGKPDGEDG